jgi:hypothetical protein
MFQKLAGKLPHMKESKVPVGIQTHISVGGASGLKSMTLTTDAPVSK